MAPVEADELLELGSRALFPRNATGAPPLLSSNSPEWTESLNVNSVQLIAMLVSDAGLAGDEPEWWNASPLGCLLIGIQPRGGWQILQRSVQWGKDPWSASFGVGCPNNVLYQYFTCSIRNRIEVWDSEKFDSPTCVTHHVVDNPNVKEPEPGKGGALVQTSSVATSQYELQPIKPKSKRKSKGGLKDIAKWIHFKVDGERDFNVARPSKLVDGSRGGQGYMCELLCPKDGTTYTIEEQAYFQFLSVVLVAMALLKGDYKMAWREALKEDFQVSCRLGRVFRRLEVGLFIFNIFTIGFVVAIGYAMLKNNFFGRGLPFIVQICSLCAWAFGAVGLLMIGGNPRVKMVKSEIPEHIEARLNRLNGVVYDVTTNTWSRPSGPEYLELKFGYLQGSNFTPSAKGSCLVHRDIIREVLSMHLSLSRPLSYKLYMGWFVLFLGISVALQIAGSLVATLYSQILAVIILIVTAVARGWGTSGSESWMIPKYMRRAGSKEGAVMLGRMESRVW
ncbi:hypothetical protein ABW19_dt0202116 [Dactylella cylindrospora]|nr:hypothetical protein ABW19_dt0202116 [Dactylella cylindrospora]